MRKPWRTRGVLRASGFSKSFILLTALMAGALAACAGPEQATREAEPVEHCTEPRPQVCTLEYAPVCAFLGNRERKEFSNECAACGDPEVTGYIAGPCQPPLK